MEAPSPVPSVTQREGYIQGSYEPGNSTRYTAVAIPTDGYLCLGWLGSIDDGWIVVSGMANKKAHLLDSSCLYPRYIAEKFDLHGPDAEMFTELLKAMIGRP